MAKHSDLKIQLGISISNDRQKHEPISLNFDLVSGAFTLLLIGSSIAFVVFIIELIWFQYNNYNLNQVITLM